MSTTIITEAPATFDAKALAGAIANTKNRAIQVVEVGRARDRDGYTAAEVAAFVNQHLDSDEQLTAGRFGDGAVKNLIATYRFLCEWDIIEGADKLTALHVKVIAKALNVIEKGQSTAVDEARVAINDLDTEDPGFLGGVFKALVEANKRALELRKAKPEPEPKDDDDDAEQSADEPAGRSLVDVIAMNVAALDWSGLTTEELDRLVSIGETLMTRAINATAIDAEVEAAA